MASQRNRATFSRFLEAPTLTAVNKMKPTHLTSLAIRLFLAVLIVNLPVAASFAQDAAPSSQAPTEMPPAPDNTEMNKRDQAPQEQTSDQAGMQMSDVDIMQKIRKAVVADDSLSTYAHNVKIITKDGKVTLKGPVRSTHERASVKAKAIAVVGARNVTDQMSVKTMPPSE